MSHSLSCPPGRSVAVVVSDLQSVFEMAVACEVFGLDRTEDDIPSWDFAVCSSQPGRPVRARTGFSIDTPYGLDRADVADLVIVPGWPLLAEAPSPALTRMLRRAVDRGAWVLGLCTGTFALAAAGLLDGRRATTHWRLADEFRLRFPDIDLDPNVLYVSDPPVLTSAGTAAAIDLCLYVVRTMDGPKIANAVARRMVVPPHRDGGQAQFIERPVPLDAHEHDLVDLLAWMTRHLDRDLSVEELARRAHLSPRTFARKFLAQAGTTPHRWLTGQRVLHAQQLLEETDLDVDRIAEQCGFGSAATLRHHFTSWVGTSPQRYRRTFRRAAPLLA